MTVNEVSKISNVTVRALQYYDKIGLLKPEKVGENGYRLYSSGDLETLQQILFFKEIGFPLAKIAGILKDRDFDRIDALKQHKKILELKRKRLQEMIDLTDRIIKGESTMSFKEFDDTPIKEHIKKYEAQAKEKWGGTDAYKQSAQKTSKYTAADWAKIKAEADKIYELFAEHMENGDAADKAFGAVEKWQEHINMYYYECSDEMLLGLADMYVNDPRFTKNIDKYKEGLARYISSAIKVCKNSV